jgi:hypothetical protein
MTMSHLAPPDGALDWDNTERQLFRQLMRSDMPLVCRIRPTRRGSEILKIF